MAAAHPNYDATFCGKLPLHQTNLIQPHGVVLLITPDTWEIIQVSENIDTLIKEAATDITGQTLQQYLTEESSQKLAEKLKANYTGKLPITLQLNEAGNHHKLLTLVHKKKDYYVLEMELKDWANTVDNSFSHVYQQLKFVVAALEHAATITEVCQIAADQIKELSGFDKVMIYTFAEDWTGTVIAEAQEEGMDRYLGLRFPASDIPKPARDMYLTNPYRIIPDRNYTPVRLYPLLNPVTNAFSDLSECDLRSVAAVHLEYLANMGVVASMSTRIVQQEKLWGLISCHHRTAKFLSYEMCSVFELLSNMLSSRIHSLQYHEALAAQTTSNQLYTQLVDHIYHKQDLLSAFVSNDTLFKDILSADGVVLSWNGRIEMTGNTPTKQEVDNLVYWLQSGYGLKTYHQPALSGVFEEATDYATTASGLLALPIQPEAGNFLLAFRPEVLQKIAWGGNPDDAITFEKETANYHPRNSFKQYQETVQQTAIPWTEAERKVAENFRNFIVEYTLNQITR